ncbi:TPC1 Mitochondrial thiamine pyrophosphate carrier 1 [Candida maltosa Xu316]
MAGSMSGAVSRAVTAPLDTIKIRLQLHPKHYKDRKSVPTIVKNLLRDEGIVAFWKGNVPAEILYILYGGTQFASYSILSKSLQQFENKHNLHLSEANHSLIAGTGSGMASTVVTYPFDLLRTRLVANRNRSFLSMSGTVKEIIKNEGVVGIFAGVRPAMLSVSTTTGLMFWSYELAREFSKNFKHVPFIEGFCGFVAGAVSKGITFPLDTLRKRCQMCSVVYGKPFSASHLLVTIVKKEGFLGLYKGYGVSLVKTAPTSAISLFMYEYSLSFIRKLNL